ncbi:uncharacterized, partial [Tachysurus ichikawai]
MHRKHFLSPSSGSSPYFHQLRFQQSRGKKGGKTLQRKKRLCFSKSCEITSNILYVSIAPPFIFK